MTVLFMGGEIGSFIPSDSDTIEETSGTTASYRNANFTRAALVSDEVLSYGQSATFAQTADTWTRWSWTLQYQGQMSWYNAAGTEVVRVTATTSSVTLSYNNGSGFTDVGTASITLSETRQNFNLHIEPTKLTLYASGTERITSGAIDLSLYGGVAFLRNFGSTLTGLTQEVALTEVIVSTASNIGWRLLTYVPTGNGANTGFTGDYTTIDEAIYADADYSSAATAGLKSTFTLTPVAALPSNYRVQAVGVYARARQTGSGSPTNIKLVLRSSGTDYSSTAQSLSFAYGAHGAIWETNPATSSAFLTTEISALQLGFEAAA